VRYLPAVTVVPAGACRTFFNNDPLEHHVHGSAEAMTQIASNSAGGFNLSVAGKTKGQPARSADVIVSQPDEFLLGCHLNASMSANTHISDPSLTDRTNADSAVVKRCAQRCCQSSRVAR
jgi:hypothetical protein